ncbi:MAG: PD40 domain-containing protein [Frankiaceae bacterium]|nr:PD40 domain-containing protein [Frankiaceae bacterium]MBV9872727.1 PD40 domain-containing protein [Frankiaceae bacterium]
MGQRVRLSCLVTASAFAMIAGVTIGATPAAAAAPGAPSGLESFPALHGIGLDWKGDFSGATPTSYSVYSRPDAGAGWTFLGSAPVNGQRGTYIDATIDNGDTMQYSITESNNGGESARSNVISVTRPVTDPLAGSSNAITVDATTDGGLTTEYFDPSINGTVTLVDNTLTGSGNGQSASADIPRVSGPGDYTIGNGGIDFNLTTDGTSCTTATGTLSVIDAAYNATLDPVLFSASYAVSCDGKPTTYGDLRYKSTQPYRDLVVTPATISGGTPVSGSGRYFDVTIANYGTQTAHVGGVAITGPNADDWTFNDGNCLYRNYPARSSCTAYAVFTPSDRGHRKATFTFADNSARGTHTISLNGQGQVAPSAPPTTARIAVHRVEITWEPPIDDGDAPITLYRVYRTAPGQGQQLVATVSPQNPDVGGSYTDPNVPTGITFEYSVLAENAAGDSIDTVVEATAPSDEILLDASQAMTTAGDEPVSIASPDIRGRVAVVPGATRIVFPQKYPDNVDLVVASPFGTVPPARLTTMGATAPAVSMDGTTVAFVHVNGSGMPSIWTVPVRGGAPAQVATGVTNPSWLPDGRTLVAERESQDGSPETGQNLVTVLPSGTVTDIPGTTDGHEPAVSPDGQHIAYQLSVGGTYSLAVSPVAGGVPQTSSPGAQPISSISWRTDSAELFASVNGKVKGATYSSSSGPGTLSTISPSDVDNVKWPAYINSNAVSLPDPIPVTGKRPSVSITAAPGTNTVCSIDGGEPTNCPSKWVSVLDLASGSHQLVVTSTPAQGVASTVIWTFDVDRTKPSVKLLHLPRKTKHHKVAINYIAHDANGIKSYDVRYRKGTSRHALGKYRYPSSWQATTHMLLHLHVKTGKTYCVSVRARDTASNLSKWSKQRCVAAK